MDAQRVHLNQSNPYGTDAAVPQARWKRTRSHRRTCSHRRIGQPRARGQGPRFPPRFLDPRGRPEEGTSDPPRPRFPARFLTPGGGPARVRSARVLRRHVGFCSGSSGQEYVNAIRRASCMSWEVFACFLAYVRARLFRFRVEQEGTMQQ